MPRQLLIIAATLCASVSGCIEFQHPLSPPEKAEYDKSVFGTWYHQEKDENGKMSRTFLHIGAAGQPTPNNGDKNFAPQEPKQRNTRISYEKLTRVVFTEYKPNGEVESSSWLAYPTHLGKLKYANVPMFEEGKIFTYFYWKYDLDGDQLSVWTEVDKEAVDRMIKSGKLHQNPDSNQIAESPEKLRMLLTDGGDAILFPDEKKTVFRRLKLPD